MRLPLMFSKRLDINKCGTVCYKCRAVKGSHLFLDYKIASEIEAIINPKGKAMCHNCAAYMCTHMDLADPKFEFLDGPFARKE